MSKIVDRLTGAAAKKILVIDGPNQLAEWLSTILPSEGMGIVMESDLTRASAIRNELQRVGLGDRVSVIAGPPSRMLHKIAGPFDVVIGGDASGLSILNERVRRLLREGGLIIAVDPNGELTESTKS